MSTLKILHIIWSANVGGIEKIVLDLSSAQQQGGKLHAEVMVCSNGGVYVEKFRSAGIQCHVLGMKGAMNFSVSRWRSLKKIFSGFDVLHFHSFNPWVAMGAVASGKIVFYTEHGNFAMGRKRRISEKINNRLLEYFLNKKVNFISFNSGFSEKIARQRYGLKNTTGKVISNGIDFGNNRKTDASFIPDSVKERIAGKFIVGTCSRFVAVKKIERLIRVFAKFSKGKADVVLLLAGDGPLRKDYEQLAQELSVSNSTIFTGFSNHALALQQCMDVAVYPSGGEAFGLVAVESLSLGVPVLVFEDGGGLCEIVSGISPLDVVRDEETLLQRITYYYTNKHEIPLLKESRANYARKYDIKRMESEFYDLYVKLTS